MCGIIGIYKQDGSVNVELYEGLLMLQHRGQDSAGMVTTDWNKFREYKANGLVKDVFSSKGVLDKLQGKWCRTHDASQYKVAYYGPAARQFCHHALCAWTSASCRAKGLRLRGSVC